MKKLLLLLLCLCLTAPALADKNTYELPIDFSGGYIPLESNFTDTTYEDESLSVRMEKRDIDGVRYDIAWIKAASPTQLRTAVAGEPNESKSELASRMSRDKNAVVAINGEYYIQRTEEALVYRQGIAFRYLDPQNTRKDVLVIDEAGDLHVFLGGDSQVQELVDFLQSGHKIINGFSFGPAIVKNGEALPLPERYRVREDGRDSGLFDSAVRAPRMVIAQVGPLEYVFVEAEGRNDVSKGVTTDDMGKFMASLGVQTAYCLDGGNTCVMMFHRKYYDSNYRDSERELSDIVYVCTAVPDGGM
ncbi:MAG: phosphodiester glycosidase family protein [Clostridia bacterium]|nr:phosphodiester glycosidase family protein [Clostridia bacterium]MBR0217989.1 phosphodiester glycosidase family protein [Clostridia bacterium]